MKVKINNDVNNFQIIKNKQKKIMEHYPKFRLKLNLPLEKDEVSLKANNRNLSFASNDKVFSNTEKFTISNININQNVKFAGREDAKNMIKQHIASLSYKKRNVNDIITNNASMAVRIGRTYGFTNISGSSLVVNTLLFNNKKNDETQKEIPKNKMVTQTLTNLMKINVLDAFNISSIKDSLKENKTISMKEAFESTSKFGESCLDLFDKWTSKNSLEYIEPKFRVKDSEYIDNRKFEISRKEAIELEQQYDKLFN